MSADPVFSDCDHCHHATGRQPVYWGLRRFCSMKCCTAYAQLGGNSGTTPPVAAPSGDFCADCGRSLNVNEPVYRAAGGGVRCMGCNDAIPEPRPVDTHLHTVADLQSEPSTLRTSQLMRRCASLLLGTSLPGSLKEVARQYANELHGRAFELERVADTCDGYMNDSGCRLLRAIGEVRS